MAAQVNAGSGDELTVAYRRLNAAYQQTLRYAETFGASTSRCSAPSTSRCSGWPMRWKRRMRTRKGTPSGSAPGAAGSRRPSGCARGSRPDRPAGLLHDIGKIAFPRRCCATRRARDRGMGGHAQPSVDRAQIVAPFDFFAAGALMIRHHHERCDGSGYPDGLTGTRSRRRPDHRRRRRLRRADVEPAVPRRAAHATVIAHLGETAGRTLDEDAVAAFIDLIQMLSTAKADVGARPVLRASSRAPLR